LVRVSALWGQILLGFSVATIEHVLVIALLHDTTNLILTMRLGVGADFATQCIFNVTLHLILAPECIALGLGVVLAQRIPDAANITIDTGLWLFNLKGGGRLVPILCGVADSLILAISRTNFLDIQSLHIGGVAFFYCVNRSFGLRILGAICVLLDLVGVLTRFVAGLGVVTPLALFDGLLGS
jgi:hypothetical protein